MEISIFPRQWIFIQSSFEGIPYRLFWLHAFRKNLIVLRRVEILKSSRDRGTLYRSAKKVKLADQSQGYGRRLRAFGSHLRPGSQVYSPHPLFRVVILILPLSFPPTYP